MAVVVTVAAPNIKEIKHGNGVQVLVREEGHLFVQSEYDQASASTIAVYAPGKWLHVQVKQDE